MFECKTASYNVNDISRRSTQWNGYVMNAFTLHLTLKLPSTHNMLTNVTVEIVQYTEYNTTKYYI